MGLFSRLREQFRSKELTLSPKEKFNRRIKDAFANDPLVLVDRILVGDGKNPLRKTGNYTPVWIPLACRDTTASHGRYVCKKVYTLYRLEFMADWNAIELLIGGFEANGSFDKAYRLTCFNEDVDEAIRILEYGLPGKLRGIDIGWLFIPKIDIELVDV